MRRYTPDDRDNVIALFGDADVMRYVGDGRPLEVSESAALLDKILSVYETDPSFFIWAIQEGGAYAGHAELKRRKGRSEYELIYFLQRKRWGRSIGRCVVDLLLEEARTREIPFVIATVDPQNAASIAILCRRGFEKDQALSRELDTAAYRLRLT